MDNFLPETSQCPICQRDLPTQQIEVHVDRCIFLNSSSEVNPLPTKAASPFQKGQKRPATNNSMEKPSKSPRQEIAPTSSSAAVSCKPQKNSDCDFTTPLAKQVEPKSLDDFFGQQDVLGKNTILRQLLEKQEIPNMILWGPPGCGKTSLASVINGICKENNTKLRFQTLCAANSGVADVNKIVMDAKMQHKFGKQTVLFMDEVHRFNKKQQDIFLKHVEIGDICLIGATTENPSFSINSALLSRCRVIVMEKLDEDSVVSILKRAASKFSLQLYGMDVENDGSSLLYIEEDALKWLAETCDGDARIALGNLQLILQQNTKKTGLITVNDIKEGIKKSHLLYDRRGEEHYNIISAMHKSIRGSDSNAALYWTTRMIVSGEDPRFIARRLVRAASEDIGNADPKALQLAVSTMQGCQLLGMPEADVLLAQCAIYLARAPKSREADSALAAAKQVIKNCGVQPSVPMHIRNAPTELMRELGYGQVQPGTRASFMPKELENVNFFKKK